MRESPARHAVSRRCDSEGSGRDHAVRSLSVSVIQQYPTRL
jgi:hypothetical protein